LGEDVDGVAGHGPRLVPKAPVESRLAAASLGLWKFNLKPQIFQDFDYGKAHIGKKVVHQTGNKELNCGDVTFAGGG
jgi:hypothetical protein